MEFTLQNNATDEFRAPAVAASQRALKAAGTFADPAAAGISYCLPHLEDAPAIRARMRLSISVAFFGALLSLLTSLALFAALGNGFIPKSQTATGVAIAAVVLGASLLLIAPKIESRYVERLLRSRRGDLWLDPGRKPRLVRIENAATYNKLKPIPDDYGAVIVHPDSACLQIEGITHRYLIYAQDIRTLTMNRASAPESFNLSYAIAGERLDLTIILFRSSLYGEIQSKLLAPLSQ